jgi:uncharacterized protein DUF4304
MTSKTLVKHLDSLLVPLGFVRRKAVWNRKVGLLTYAFDIQVSKAGDAITINIGVLDTYVHKTLWDSDPPDIVEPPACTVSIRIGELIDGKDKWWPIDDEKYIQEIPKTVSELVIQFLERMHTLEEMETWLANSKSGISKFPAYRIGLAIIKYRLGKTVEACDLLADLQKHSIGGWRTRASEIAGCLGCGKG